MRNIPLGPKNKGILSLTNGDGNVIIEEKSHADEAFLDGASTFKNADYRNQRYKDPLKKYPFGIKKRSSNSSQVDDSFLDRIKTGDMRAKSRNALGIC